MKPIIYFYDYTNNIYIPTVEPQYADDNPEEEGEYLIPGNATLKQPPETVESEAAVFNKTSDRWFISEDYRGWIGYNTIGEEQKINTVGITPHPSWTIEKPFNLIEERVEKIKDIDREVLEKRAAPTRIGATNYRSDMGTLTLLTTMITVAEYENASSINVPDFVSVETEMSIADAKNLVVKLMESYQSYLTISNGKKAMANKALNKVDLDNVLVSKKPI